MAFEWRLCRLSTSNTCSGYRQRAVQRYDLLVIREKNAYAALGVP